MSIPRPRSPVSSACPALLACALLSPGCGDDSSATAATTGTTLDTTNADPASTGAPTTTTSAATGENTTDAPTSGNTDSGATGTSTADTDPGSTSAVTGTGTTTDTGTTGTTTGDTTTGELDDLPTSCQDADFPVLAPLCGAEGPACVGKRDELVSAMPVFRNDMPALVLRGDCGPAVLYSEAVGGYHGFYGERTGANMWTVESTPMPLATAGLEYDPGTAEASAIVDDGAFGVTLWRRSGGGVWKQLSALVGMNHARAPQLARDGEGALHLGHIDSEQHALLERFDGAWKTDSIDSQADIHVRLALDAAAAPRITYWSSKEATWKLYFAAPPAAPELVTPLQSNVLERPHTSLALAGPDQTPWVFAARRQADQQHHDLVLLHRLGPAKWAEETLVAENAATDKTCDAEPGPGQVCAYDYVRLYPLALLTAGAEVRAVYTAINYKGSMTADCKNMPIPFCVWLPQSDSSTAELRVAWPGAAPNEHQVIAGDVFTDRATARLDPGGNMHLAFYDQAPGTPDPVVRYLAVGP